MTQGPQGEGKILDIVKDATGIDAMATSRLVLDALQALGMKKVVLLTPYKSNKAVIDYLTAAGVDRGARRGAEARGQGFRQRHAGRNGRGSPRRTTGRTPTAFSCPAPTPRRSRRSPTSSAMLGKPVVNCNQAVLWGAVKRLQRKVGAVQADAGAGTADGAFELEASSSAAKSDREDHHACRAARCLARSADRRIGVAFVRIVGAGLSSRPVRMIVPLGAGGPTDLVGRYLAQALGESAQAVVLRREPPGRRRHHRHRTRRPSRRRTATRCWSSPRRTSIWKSSATTSRTS